MNAVTLLCVTVLTSFDPAHNASGFAQRCTAPVVSPAPASIFCQVPTEGTLASACMCRVNPSLHGCNFG